jgi:hypothetical protein
MYCKAQPHSHNTQKMIKDPEIHTGRLDMQAIIIQTIDIIQMLNNWTK